MAAAKPKTKTTKAPKPRGPSHPPDSPWVTTTNERRNRPMITLTVDPDTKQGLKDLQAPLGVDSAGAVVDKLVAAQVAAEKNLAWTLETFGYLSPEYATAARRVENLKDARAEADRERAEHEAALARVKAIDWSRW